MVLMLDWQVRLFELFIAAMKTGTAMATRIAMINMTIMSSMRAHSS